MTEGRLQIERPRKRPVSDYIGLALTATLAVGLLSAPIYAVIKSSPQHDSPPMVMGDIGGAPVDLSTLPPSLAKLYRGAESHATHFEEIPCFCGCQEGRLQHRNLLDCYVLKDGAGWESHAVGCDVCQGEAEMALDLLKDGSPIAEIKSRIVDSYGTPREIRDLQEG